MKLDIINNLKEKFKTHLKRISVYPEIYKWEILKNFQSNWDIEAQGPPPGDFKAGFASSNFPVQTSYLNGALDELRIWDSALTANDVLEVYDDPGAECDGEPGPCGVSVECAVTDDKPAQLNVSVSIRQAGACECEALDVTLDGEPLAAITVDNLSAGVPLPSPCDPGSEHTITARCTMGGDGGREASCTFICPDVGGARFVRGDADSSGTINLTDGVVPLNYLFLGAAPPACMDAADVDDSGDLQLTDAIYLFNWLFLGGPEPTAPTGTTSYIGDHCGEDPAPDKPGKPLDCMTIAAKCQ